MRTGFKIVGNDVVDFFLFRREAGEVLVVVGVGSGWELSVTALVFVVVVVLGLLAIAEAAAAIALSIIELTGRFPVPLRFPFFKRALNLAKSSSSVAIFFFAISFFFVVVDNDDDEDLDFNDCDSSSSSAESPRSIDITSCSKVQDETSLRRLDVLASISIHIVLLLFFNRLWMLWVGEVEVVVERTGYEEQLRTIRGTRNMSGSWSSCCRCSSSSKRRIGT